MHVHGHVHVYVRLDPIAAGCSRRAPHASYDGETYVNVNVPVNVNDLDLPENDPSQLPRTFTLR